MIEIQPASQIDLEALRCEYLVVGSGAGGSVVASELADAGKEVFIIEEGSYYDSYNESGPPIARMRELYRNGGVTPFLGSPIIGFAEGMCVGGTTEINGGLLWRTPQKILDLWKSEYGIGGYGESELGHHFDKIEKRLNINTRYGKEGNQDSLALEVACNSLGWKIVPAPRAVKNCSNNNQCPLGCPSGAKQGMSQTYLQDACRKGATVLYGMRVIKLCTYKGRATGIVGLVDYGGHKKLVDISAKNLILCCGAINTPYLLSRSGVNPPYKTSLQFHINVKTVAKFKEPINAQNGTIFRSQVQEFENDGLLIMPSNCNLSYLMSALAHLGNSELEKVRNSSEYYGLFAGQIKAKSRARVHSMLKAGPVLSYSLASEDVKSIKKTMKRLAVLFFSAGAEEIYFPVNGMPTIRTIDQLDSYLIDLKPKALDLISVHAMSSCPMGKDRKSSVVNEDGKLHALENLHICDASILPTNIGESPQGTIMAFSHEIMARHLH